MPPKTNIEDAINSTSITIGSLSKGESFVEQLSEKKDIQIRVGELILAGRVADIDEDDLRILMMLWVKGAEAEKSGDTLCRGFLSPSFADEFRALTLILKAAGINLEEFSKDAFRATESVQARPAFDEPLIPPAALNIFKQWGWHILIATMLMTAIADEPLDLNFGYGYFMLLRFACCATFSFWAWSAHEQKKPKWRNAFVVIALFYNPFLPVKLGDADIWMWVNLATIFFVVASWRILKESKTAS